MVSREEAIERAQQDQGDNDDLVVMSKQRSDRTRIYHATADCSHLQTDTTIELTRQQAQNKEYGPCKVCTIETGHKSRRGTQPTDLIEAVREKLANE
jgi:hypothetical protein